MKKNMDNIHKNTNKFFKGITKVASIVRPTYGPGGGNVLVENVLSPFHIITNDGKAMVDDIKLADPVENTGANFMKEAGNKADKESGNGRKTTMILLDAILKEAIKSDSNPKQIRKSLLECSPLIEAHLLSQSIPVTPDTVGKVAAIASDNEKLGTLYQEIYQQIGKDGIVELAHSYTQDTFYELKEGIRLRNSGYIAEYMANEDGAAIYSKPKILITKQKISTINDLNPLFEQLEQKGIHEIVIFCDEFDHKVLSALAFTHKQAIFKSLIIKAPTLWKDWIYEDFALITGATVISPETGVSLKSVSLEHLGTCGKITSTKEETTVVGIKDISEHIAKLQELGKSNDQMKLRASWLQTKAAILKLGANSDTDLNYLTRKAKDGRNSSYLALQGGIVEGGGIALQKAIDCLPNTVGGKILSKALSDPYKQILKNSGETSKPNYVDVYDAYSVVRNAIVFAISLAASALTIKECGIITLNKQHENTPKMPIM